MIKIDALYFLLLIELLLVLAGATVFSLVLAKKYSSLYKSGMKKIGGAVHERENLQKQQAEVQVIAPLQAAASDEAAVAASAKAETDSIEHEKCKIEVTILESKLKEKIKLLNDLQTKFDELEKEYFILYHQQQKQAAETAGDKSES